MRTPRIDPIRVSLRRADRMGAPEARRLHRIHMLCSKVRSEIKPIRDVRVQGSMLALDCRKMDVSVGASPVRTHKSIKPA
ncbi:MAG TPA: hypothetical protein VG345_04880, partial [Bryobacteraceae bacterium]|nr:hypothetical protein [Bryobacteraceae bacterium]